MTFTRQLLPLALGFSLALTGLLVTAEEADAQESLTVRFDTSATPNPQFGGQNIIAIWVEDNLGNYVQTIGRWSDNTNHRRYLLDWLTASNRPNDNPVPDGYVGGTFADYQTGLMVTWDFTDPAGALIPDGTYTLRMELADRNSQNAGENNEGTFTFVKNGTASQVTGSDGGFNNVTVDYAVLDAALCGNGAIDSGETCDSGGADVCPTTCEETGDFCMVNDLQGSAATCNSECVIREITECGANDGCCPAGCGAQDADCADGSNASAGCSVGGSSAPLSALLVLIGLVLLRRRNPKPMH